MIVIGVAKGTQLVEIEKIMKVAEVGFFKNSALMFAMIIFSTTSGMLLCNDQVSAQLQFLTYLLVTQGWLSVIVRRPRDVIRQRIADDAVTEPVPKISHCRIVENGNQNGELMFAHYKRGGSIDVSSVAMTSIVSILVPFVRMCRDLPRSLPSMQAFHHMP